jgi:hypothetical protein
MERSLPMQDNTITLSVDEANDGVTTADVDHIYQRFDSFSTRSLYHHNGHEPDMRDMLGFYRTAAKRNGNNRGSQRSSFKFTKDVEVTGVDGNTVITPMYFEVNASIPLGVSDADIMKERQKCISLLDDDSIMTPLNTDLSI